jgi:hypothetical protein
VKSRFENAQGRALGPTFNRRSFIRGAGSVAVGLPFLEGLPERSAWAAGSTPVFTFFIVAQNGVVGDAFFPNTVGALTTANVGPVPTGAVPTATEKATAYLAPHAANLVFIKGINYPKTAPQGCGHAEGLCQTLTGVAPGSTGNTAYSGGPSADVLIGKALGQDPLALYAGTKGYIAERISFKAAGAGQVRAADVNPYTLYSKVVSLTTSTPSTPSTGTGGSGGSTPVDPVAAELANTRKSVNDLVRGEMKSIMANSALSKADKDRLQQHLDAIRDVEMKMDGMAVNAMSCGKAGLPTDKYEALRTGFAFKGSMMEDIVKLHLQIMAVAFGCNYSRVGTLQWGDGTDGTKYDVPSNSGLGWSFHQLSHRIMSDSASGNNPTAKQAHHEIDGLRMQSLAVGFDAFKAHGLEKNSMIIWTNSIADGPSHVTRDVPMIIWGNGGGALKQGVFVDAGGGANAKILNTIIAAATADKGGTAATLGGGGTFAGIMA